MQKRILCYTVALLFSSFLPSQEITAVYTPGKPIWDLRNFSGATDMSAQDDGTSQGFDLGFEFKFFGETFDKAYMASNGCLILGQLAIGNNWEKNCTQYEPSEAPNTNYTLYPFWTDLIMGDNSQMLAMHIDNKMIFGWYEMWEYYREDSKNTFEVWLYPNNSYEARYSELDIKDHDVFIGVQGNENERETYYFHDKCFTGQVNSKECVSQDWNDTAMNFDLENDGSVLVGEEQNCSDPLVSPSCSGYWEAYEDQQCALNPQFGPFCSGYKQEDNVAFFNDESVDYGYQEEDLWYDEEYDEWLDPNDPCYENGCENFTDADWYALDVDQFGQEQVDDWFGAEISFDETGTVDFNTTPMDTYVDVDIIMNEWDAQQVQARQEEELLDEFLFQETFLVEDYSEPDTFIEFDTVEQLEEWFEEETERYEESFEEEEFAYAEEPEEEFLEEIFEEEFVEEIFEDIEERMAEAEFEEQLEREEAPTEFEENFVEEFQMAEREEATGKSSITRELALSVISSALSTAQNSVSGTTSGTTIHATGGTTGASSSTSSGSGGGISTSSSPSMSDQIASASVQTNQLLDMSFNSSVDTSMSSVAVEVETVSTSLSVDTTTTQTIQNEIDVSVSTGNTASEADIVADKILAQNIQAAQEDVQTQQEETGEYGAEDTIIAYMGFVPDFNSYRLVTLPQKELWYEPKSIYANNMLADNLEGFYQMAGQSLNTLSQMKELQPNL